MDTKDTHKELSRKDFIYPLFSKQTEKDRKRSWLFPFYYHDNSDEASSWHLLFFYSVHTKGDWYQKRFVLGPIFMDTKDTHKELSRKDFIYPLFSKQTEEDRKRSWLFPFYYHDNDLDSSFTIGSLALLPPYYVNSKRPDGRIFHIWPFYGKVMKDSYKENSCIWPLIRFGRDSESDNEMNHFLLYYNQKEDDHSLTALFPLWWHETKPDETKDGTLFLHWYERDKEKETDKLSLLWLVPNSLSLFMYEHEPQHTQHSLFPFYKYDTNEQEDSLSWCFPWPLFLHGGRSELSQKTVFLWKILFYEKKDENTKEFRFLWRLIRKKKTATSSVFEFNPFYYHESEKDKGSYWSILGGLIGSETTKEGNRNMRFLWLF
jgi:hypothetical protein